jgi:cytosine/adenosine deaminase-related metal-dependent hydrolase
MIIRARIVMTMDGAPIENGAVSISENRIRDVGSFDKVKTRNTGDTIDLGEQILLPGLINAHCHLDYTSLRGKIWPQKSFTEWIRAINEQKTRLSPNDYIASISDGFAEAKRFGTTAIANLTAFPELVSKVQPPIRTWWFPELLDIRTPERANELVGAAIESLGTARPQLARRDEGVLWGLAPHALFTASKNVFRRCHEIAEQKHRLLTTHLAESREEMEMFRDGSGPLYEFIKRIGRPMNDCGNETPLERFLDLIDNSGSPNRQRTIEVNRSYRSWIVAHLNELIESDFDLLERLNSKFHIVHCPRSHNYFGHTPFAFDRLHLFGFNICLGTDSLASNRTLSLFDEMRAFQKNSPRVRPEEILKMVTVNPACALRQENALGKIRGGALADLVAVPFNGGDLFEEIVAFAGEPWMMIDGRVQ